LLILPPNVDLDEAKLVTTGFWLYRQDY